MSKRIVAMASSIGPSCANAAPNCSSYHSHVSPRPYSRSAKHRQNNPGQYPWGVRSFYTRLDRTLKSRTDHGVGLFVETMFGGLCPYCHH